mmetsp:Transcript_38849/g.90348  ORF Transcript_38849/g.90348 Transcript_38849/m.90348 type:complete len:236 (+) Transcript_38849:347-1054(+)
MVSCIAALPPNSANHLVSSQQVIHLTSPVAHRYYHRILKGWDGTTALGGAVDDSKPARMLDEIREVGETLSEQAELFNANFEMSSDELMFEEFIEMVSFATSPEKESLSYQIPAFCLAVISPCMYPKIKQVDECYEYGLIEFKNGDIVNEPGENDGSAKVLSYAALANFDNETTLKLWGQYYREVLADPDGGSHPNIRNFMKYGWEGVPFENGIALTKKNSGDNEWDTFSESWIP